MTRALLIFFLAAFFCVACGNSQDRDSATDETGEPSSGNDASLFSGYERSVEKADAVEGQLMERADRHRKQLEEEGGG